MIETSKIDSEIIKILRNGPSYPSKISEDLGVLRTTVQYRLKKMSSLGLINKKQIGRKSVWSVNIQKAQDPHNKYLVFRGKDDFIKSYYNVLRLPKGSIVLVIQGSSAAKKDMEIFPPLFLKETHRVFKRKKIILKGIVNKEILKSFDSLNNDMTKSHVDRAQSLKLFSDTKFLSYGEIMSTDKFLLLANPKKQVSLVIKDKDITKIFNDAIKLIFELSEGVKTFNINLYLKSKLTNPDNTLIK